MPAADATSWHATFALTQPPCSTLDECKELPRVSEVLNVRMRAAGNPASIDRRLRRKIIRGCCERREVGEGQRNWSTGEFRADAASADTTSRQVQRPPATGTCHRECPLLPVYCRRCDISMVSCTERRTRSGHPGGGKVLAEPFCPRTRARIRSSASASSNGRER